MGLLPIHCISTAPFQGKPVLGKVTQDSCSAVFVLGTNWCIRGTIFRMKVACKEQLNFPHFVCSPSEQACHPSQLILGKRVGSRPQQQIYACLSSVILRARMDVM